MSKLSSSKGRSIATSCGGLNHRSTPFDNTSEFKPLGVCVTVLAAGVTDTAVLGKFGLDPKTMPMKPMSVEQCVSEALDGLSKNRSRVVPGRMNRILNALVPVSLSRKMLADLLGKGLANKSAPANARAGSSE